MPKLPCQSFSLAGKRLGELDPRGLLFYNFYEYVKTQKPKYFIIENVKGLLSDANGKTFQTWLDLLGQSVNNQHNMFSHDDSLMYNLHWQVLNSKDFGVPQNRERVFIIGIRNDLPNNFRFPVGFPLEKRLKDILDTDVDEKYYLSDNMLEYMNNRSANFNAGKIKYGDDIASTITRSSSSLDISDNIIVVAQRGRTENKGEDWHSSNHVQKLESREDGLTNTISSVQKDNLIIEPAILTPKRTEFGKETRKKYEAGELKLNRSEITKLEPRTDGISNTISTVQKDNLLIEPQSQVERLLERTGVDPTGVTEPTAFDVYNKKLKTDGISPTLTEPHHNSLRLVEPSVQGAKNRIRRLTPTECGKLQGFAPDFIMPVSDTQKYRQFGNTITTNVIKAILKNLLT